MDSLIRELEALRRRVEMLERQQERLAERSDEMACCEVCGIVVEGEEHWIAHMWHAHQKRRRSW